MSYSRFIIIRMMMTTTPFFCIVLDNKMTTTAKPNPKVFSIGKLDNCNEIQHSCSKSIVINCVVAVNSPLLFDYVTETGGQGERLGLSKRPRSLFVRTLARLNDGIQFQPL